MNFGPKINFEIFKTYMIHRIYRVDTFSHLLNHKDYRKKVAQLNNQFNDKESRRL